MPRMYSYPGGGFLNWYGGEVEKSCVEVAVVVTHNITKAAAEYARGHHDLWQNDTFRTEDSVFAAEPRVFPGPIVQALWGAHGAALFLEMGFHDYRGFDQPPKPWLRPAADATYRIGNFAGALTKEFP